MKKSRKLWGFLTFAFLFMLTLNVSCKHKNDDPKPKPAPTPTPTPGPAQKVKVFFQPSPLKMATIKASSDGVESQTTDGLGSIEVEAGKTITFEVTDINEDFLPDEWTNVTSSSEDKMQATLKATKNVRVIFKLKDKPLPTVKVTYSIVNEHDSDGIHQGLLGVIDKSAGDKTVLSGDEVEIGHVIHITANPNNYNGQHRIKEWIFTSPDMSVLNTQEDVSITLDKSHVETGINFTIEFEPGEVPDPPLPDGKVRVKSGIYLWKNLNKLAYAECGLTYVTVGSNAEFQGGTDLQVDKGTTIVYRFEPEPGKVIYKWDGVGVSGMVVDPTDPNKVTLVANEDMFLKGIVKNEGMSIFSVFVKDENGEYVKEDFADIVAKHKNDQDELVNLEVSKKYVQGPTGKDVILELMPKDPSYQIDEITVMPTDVQTEKDADNKNKFVVKNVKDDIVVTIKMKKVDTVKVTILGDEHVEEASKKEFSIAKDTSWKVLKETSHIKDVGFAEGYELDKWTEDSDGGTDLIDTFTFQADKKIFVKSKIQMKRIEYSVKNGEDAVPSEKVSIKATKDGSNDEVASGSSVPYGTKINFVATIHDANWAIRRWDWHAQEDPTTQQTDHTKASITIKEDVNIICTAEEVVKLTIKGDAHVKAESQVEFAVTKGSLWRDLQWNKEIRDIKFDEGFKLAKWFKGENDQAPELKADDKFEAATTIYATSKDVNLMKFTWKVNDPDWKPMESSKYFVTAFKEGTTDAVANGADVAKGTKITIEVTFTEPNLKVRYWQPNEAQVDPTNPNKATVTVENDLVVMMTSCESVKLTITGDAHLKDESKKDHLVWKNTQWFTIRDGNWGYEDFPKSLKFDDGFVLDKYLKDNESGEELQWDTMIDKDMTVYIKTKQKG